MPLSVVSLGARADESTLTKSGAVMSIKADGVGSSQIANNAVGTTEIADNAVTGAKIAFGSDAQGDIPYYNGTDYTRLGAGTSGKFLKTQGAGANPMWDTPSVPSAPTVHEIYTSTGWNATHVSTNSSTEASVELTAITGSALTGKTYLIIDVLFKAWANLSGAGNAYAEMKIQIKETGGAYADALAYDKVMSCDANLGGTGVGNANWNRMGFRYIHTLTAGQISNGVQVKMFGKGTYTGSNVDQGAGIANIQTTLTTI